MRHNQFDESTSLCVELSRAIGDREVSFRMTNGSVIDGMAELIYTFPSGNKITKEFADLNDLHSFLHGMWEMYISRRWIRG